MKTVTVIIIALAIQGITLRDEIYAIDEFIRSLSVANSTAQVESINAENELTLETIKEPLGEKLIVEEKEIENLPIDAEVLDPEIVFTITVIDNNTAVKTTTEIKGTVTDLKSTLELKFKQVRRQALLDATHD